MLLFLVPIYSPGRTRNVKINDKREKKNVKTERWISLASIFEVEVVDSRMERSHQHHT